jgi:DNA invertase Pin-like site-specific DNA recombinase
MTRELKSTWAIYMRYSHAESRDTFTLDVQERKCRDYVASLGGEVAEVYKDEAESGTTVTNRRDYQRLLADARRGKFTHLVVSRWDRFHRDTVEAMSSKEILRRTYKIEVHSATQPSAHEGSTGLLMEGLFDLIAAHTSAEMSEKYRDGKYQNYLRGGWNGGGRVFGYDVDKDLMLHVNEAERPAVVKAFEMYATGKHSYAQIAEALTKDGYRTINGRQFNVNSVRGLLQNKVYVGQITYQETRYLDREKKHRDYSLPVETKAGVHEPIISIEVWHKVAERREERTVNQHGGGGTYNSYLLRNLVYCWDCWNKRGDFQGKPMPHLARCQCRTIIRSRTSKKHTKTYRYPQYHCVSRVYGYDCTQKAVRCEKIDEAVLSLLQALPEMIPDNWNDRLVNRMARELEDKTATERIAEVRTVLERLDFQFLHGIFTDKDEYLRKRADFSNEIDRLLPMLDVDLVAEAASLIQDFHKHFAACRGDVDEQHNLIAQIIERVFIQDGEVIAVTFKANIHLMATYGGDLLELTSSRYIWSEFTPNTFYATDFEPYFGDGSEENEEPAAHGGRLKAIIGKIHEPLESERARRDSNPRPSV